MQGDIYINLLNEKKQKFAYIFNTVFNIYVLKLFKNT